MFEEEIFLALFFFFSCYLTLMFEQHRLLEFVVERWVCSERVFIAFRTQRALIFAIISKVVPTGGKTIWYRWFSNGCNQPTNSPFECFPNSQRLVFLECPWSHKFNYFVTQKSNLSILLFYFTIHKISVVFFFFLIENIEKFLLLRRG